MDDAEKDALTLLSLVNRAKVEAPANTLSTRGEPLAHWVDLDREAPAHPGIWEQVAGATQSTLVEEPAAEASIPTVVAQSPELQRALLAFAGQSQRKEEFRDLGFEIAGGARTFDAYCVWSGGRAFLVPKHQVQGVVSLTHAVEAANFVSLSSLIELPEEWRQAENAVLREGVLVPMGSRTAVVGVDRVEACSTYSSKRVRPDLDRVPGVKGVVAIAEGKQAALLDLDPWLEKFFAARPEPVAAPAKPEPVPQKPETVAGRYVVFRVAGRRYAIPEKAVGGFGEIRTQAVLTGQVKTEKGPVPLRDIRDALTIGGESGGQYLVIENGTKTTAWAMDGIEKIHEVTEAMVPQYKDLSRDPNRKNGAVRGVLPEIRVSASSGAPIYSLDPARLVPSRPLRKR